MLLDDKLDFTGTKVALLYGDQVLTILRDDKPGLPYRNMWELAGGGREGEETAFACTRREVLEELGISLLPEMICWCKAYPGVTYPGTTSVFLVAKLTEESLNQIVFGDEGQGYKFMTVADFLTDQQVIPQLQERLRDYLREIGYAV